MPKITVTGGPCDGRTYLVHESEDRIPHRDGFYSLDGVWHANDADEDPGDALLRLADAPTAEEPTGIAHAVAKAIDGYRILIVAPTVKRATEYFTDAILPLVEPLGGGVSIRRANGAQRVTFPSGGFIRPVGLNSKGGRGISADVLGLVEVPEDDERLDDVRPALAVSKVGTIVTLEPYRVEETR